MRHQLSRLFGRRRRTFTVEEFDCCAEMVLKTVHSETCAFSSIGKQNELLLSKASAVQRLPNEERNSWAYNVRTLRYSVCLAIEDKSNKTNYFFLFLLTLSEIYHLNFRDDWKILVSNVDTNLFVFCA